MKPPRWQSEQSAIKAIQIAFDISADAQKIIKLVQDGDSYTDVEKTTIEYIRKNYNWTEGADEWFRSQIASWAARNKNG